MMRRSVAWCSSSACNRHTPRHFSIDATGQFLFVANQDSDNVVVFRIGAADGKLTRAGNPTSVAGNMPTFVAAR